MSQVSIRLGSFFRKQTAESTPETPPAGDQNTPPADESTDGDDDPEDETPAADGNTPPAAGAEGGQVIQMTQAAYTKQVADAANWNKHKAELDTLRAWKASLDGVGKGVSKGGDQNTSGKQAPTVHDQPWNQAAQEAAAKRA